MKILLVSINSQYVHFSSVPYLLKAGLEKFQSEIFEQNEIQIIQKTINDRYWPLLSDLLNSKPDVVGFSCYIWNIDLVKRLVVDLKRANSNIKILLGGPEVSYKHAQFLQQLPVDSVLCGDGEYIFAKAIHDVLNSTLEQQYISENEEWHFSNDEQLHWNALNQSLNNCGEKIFYFESTRGCPFRCSYCLASTTNQVKYLDLDYVKKCIDLLVTKNVSIIKFVDRSFNCNPTRAFEIISYINEANARQEIVGQASQTWHFEVAPHLIDERLIDLVKSLPYGLVQFEVGIQTLNKDVLNNISRHIDLEKSLLAIDKLISANRAMIHVDLIAGLPGEDMSSFVEGFNKLHSLNAHQLQLGFLKVLGGTKIESEKQKYGLVFSAFPPYQIIRSNDITWEQLQILESVERWLENLWNTGRFTNTVKYLVEKYFNHNYFEFYLLANSASQQLNGISDTVEKCSELVAECIKQICPNDMQAFALLAIETNTAGTKIKLPSMLREQILLNGTVNLKSNYRQIIEQASTHLNFTPNDKSFVNKYISIHNLPNRNILVVNHVAKDVITKKYAFIELDFNLFGNNILKE